MDLLLSDLMIITIRNCRMVVKKNTKRQTMSSQNINVGSIIRVPLLSSDDGNNNDPSSTIIQTITTKTNQKKKNKVWYRRALVATIDDDECTVIYENEIPLISHIPKNNRINQFCIIPNFDKIVNDDDNDDTTISMNNNILSLYDYEQKQSNHDDNNSTTICIIDDNCRKTINTQQEQYIQLWKERGDQLLQLGDVTVAAVCYEIALQKQQIPQQHHHHQQQSNQTKTSATISKCSNNNVSIGDTILIQVNGYIHIAEIDCINHDDETIDVTIISWRNSNNNLEEIERTIGLNDIIMIMFLSDDIEHYQERILLNLSRCLYQLSEFCYNDNQRRRSQYIHSIIISCTIVLTLAEYYRNISNNNINNDKNIMNNLTSNEQTALLLRSKAYYKYNRTTKYKHTIKDIQRLIQYYDNDHTGIVHDGNSNNNHKNKLVLEKDARLWYQTIQKNKLEIQKINKKLSKNMSQWIHQTMTNKQQEQDEDEDDEQLAPIQQHQEQSSSTSTTKEQQVESSSSSSSSSVSKFVIYKGSNWKYINV